MPPACSDTFKVTRSAEINRRNMSSRIYRLRPPHRSCRDGCGLRQCGLDEHLHDRVEVDDEFVRSGVGGAQDHVGTIRSCGVASMRQDFIDLLGHLRRLDGGLATERPCDEGGLRHSRSPSEPHVGVAAASGQRHRPAEHISALGNQGHDLRATISRCDTAGHSSCSCHAPSFSATTSRQFAG